MKVNIRKAAQTFGKTTQCRCNEHNCRSIYLFASRRIYEVLLASELVSDTYRYLDTVYLFIMLFGIGYYGKRHD